MDHWWVAELRTESADGGLHGAGEGVGCFVPNSFKQLLSGNRPPVRGEQAFEYGEFLGGKRQPPSGPDRDPARRVQAEVAEFEAGGQRRGRPSAQGPDTGHQLGEVEWLGQVVIGAQPETLDPFPDRPGRGEHQHLGLRPVSDEGPADIVAVYARQVSIQYQHVIAVHRQALQRSAAVQGHVDRHALPA
jgi:hypothetical protein